jgi:hypothetical protein
MERTCGLPNSRASETSPYAISRYFVWRREELGPACAQGHEVHYSHWFRFGSSCFSEASRLNWSTATGESTSPGEGDSTGASAERESGRGALTPNRRPSSRRASTKEQGKHWHDTVAPPSRGVARVRGAKDPTDDPAASRVACARLMAFDGTCEREAVQRAPQEIGERPLQS